MKISRMSSCHLVILSSCLSTPIYAAPITTDNLIQILQFGGPSLTDSSFSSYSTDSTYSNEFVAGVEAYGDLSSGQVGSISSSTSGTSYQSMAKVADTLTFSTATEVSFNYSVHGFLSADSGEYLLPNAYGQGRIDIYDITGIDNWLETSSLFGYFDTVKVVPEAQEISLNTVMFRFGQTSYWTQDIGEWIDIDNNLTEDGALYEVSFDLSGSFVVDPSKVYGISMGVNTYSSGGGLADFSQTGTFEFTNLGGASFSSSSGAFLTASAPVPVPLPSTIWLFAPALMGLFVGSARRKSRYIHNKSNFVPS